MRIAFFGTSRVSSSWSGAATYHRGILRALHARGHRISLFEPELRDLSEPSWARVCVYSPKDPSSMVSALEHARGFDVVLKANGVGVLDGFLEEEVLRLRAPSTQVLFWDVDPPTTLARLASDPGDPFRSLLPAYDQVLTYGGGRPVAEAYAALGARHCTPIYGALDPSTHYPEPFDSRFAADLSFLGSRLPDREARVRDFFFGAAYASPKKSFLLGGNGWDPIGLPPNVEHLGHVSTADQNALHSSTTAVLNITREGLARAGWSPAARIFEVAGAGACLITDDWAGIEHFLEPGREVLVARNGLEVSSILERLSADPSRARRIGLAGRRRILSEHTYARRARLFEEQVGGGTLRNRPEKEVSA
jgi:spore maturation protein CgeB